MTGFATAGHIARAALEAACYQVLEVVRAVEKDSGVRLAELKVDGGMVVNELLMQFQADILNVIKKIEEITAFPPLMCLFWGGLMYFIVSFL